MLVLGDILGNSDEEVSREETKCFRVASSAGEEEGLERALTAERKSELSALALGCGIWEQRYLGFWEVGVLASSLCLGVGSNEGFFI